MNETEIERMLVSLVGDGSDYSKMLNQAISDTDDAVKEIERGTSMIEGFAGSLKGFVIAAVAAFGALKVKDFLADSFGEFEESEHGLIRLSAAIRANGGDVESLVEDYEDWAGEIQKTTKYSDDAAKALLATAESFGASGDAAKRAAKDAMALAAATGGSAESMIRFTAAMAKGDVEGAKRFARLIPQLRGIKDEAELVARYNQLVATGLETMGEEANTVGGQIAILKNLFGDFQEEVGAVVAEGMKPFVAAARYAVDWLGTLGDEIDAVKEFVKGLADDLLAAWEWTKPVRQAVSSFFAFFVEASTEGWNAIWDTAKSVWEDITGFIGATGTEIRDGLVMAILFAEYALRNLDKITEIVILSMIVAWESLINDVTFFFGTTLPELGSWFAEQFPNIIIDAIDSAVNSIKNRFENIATLFFNLIDVLSGDKSLSELFDGMKNELDGVGLKFTELPKLSKRAMTDFERAASEALAQGLEDFGEGFLDFYNQKMEEFARSVGQKFTGGRRREGGGRGGGGRDDGLGKEAKDANAVLAGSAEALARISDYAARIRPGEGGFANALDPRAGMIDRDPRPVPAAGPNDVATAKDQTTLLREIRDLLRAKAAKEPETLYAVEDFD